jgi:tetratricopeptide (TPR) repeat protein
MLRHIGSLAAAAVILLLAARSLTGFHPGRSGLRPGDAGAATASKPFSDTLLSPSAASRFWQIGYELSQRPDLTPAQGDQAIILLVAAKSLDPQIAGIEPLLIELATQHSAKNYSQHVLLWLQSYMGVVRSPATPADAAANVPVDYRLVKKAIQYLLDRCPSANERRKLLEDMVTRVGNRNPAVDSELATMLGLLTLEQGDRKAAKFYFVQAYRKSKYNTTAFAKLGELAPEELTPAVYLEHLRLVIRRNPMDMEAALTYAQYSARLQLHDIAVGAFAYCADLFRYEYSGQPLPARIYLPWAIAAYNSTGQQAVSLQIADTVRQSGRFDILLEAIAGRTAARLGRNQESQQIFARAELNALQSLQSQEGRLITTGAGEASADQTSKQLAWFYCFAQPDPTKALDWANRSYSADPNSQVCISMLTYALAMTGQWDLVQKVAGFGAANQITEVALAQLQMTQGKRDEARKMLRSAIARDPGSLPAERAKGLLAGLGDKYTDPDAGATAAILTRAFGPTLVPQFTPPGQMIEARLSVPNTEFAYGLDIPATVTVLNKSREPLVITDRSLFTGRIRIDVHTSGYLNESVSNVISQTLGTQVEVPPGGSIMAPVCLSTGELRRLLIDHPQAAVKMEFSLYLDPVEALGSAVQCKLTDLKPAVCVVNRPGVSIDGGYMRSRFNAISSGQESEKAFTAQLFAGLVNEQAKAAKMGINFPYPYSYADWMKDMLRSAFASESGLMLSPKPDDWPVKVLTMADMLLLKLDQDLATLAARNLSDPKWPVRLMTLYLLSTNGGGGFDKMLDWVVQNETDDLVRGMAIALRPAK